MDTYHFFVTGLILGFSIAAPVGPIGVLCIRRTLAHGRITGLMSGLGAASADAIYGAIAAFGLTFISNLLTQQQNWLRLGGGLFLLYLGARTFFSPVTDKPTTLRSGGSFGAYTSTFVLTLTNPITILSFAAIFAGFDLGAESRSYASAALLVLGVFAGSTLWWLSLSTAVSLLRKQATPRVMLWINRISGLVIFAFGMLALFTR
jgi:threonine/homoserine/homoserine lactone efflux protein